MSENFCTDLISLFVNHLWSCDSCFIRFIILFFGVAAAVLLVFRLISFLLDKLESWSYKTRYEDMKNLYDTQSSNYSALHDKYFALLDEYNELSADYYHTCN